jgi:hypothetical protein
VGVSPSGFGFGWVRGRAPPGPPNVPRGTSGGAGEPSGLRGQPPRRLAAGFASPFTRNRDSLFGRIPAAATISSSFFGGQAQVARTTSKSRGRVVLHRARAALRGATIVVWRDHGGRFRRPATVFSATLDAVCGDADRCLSRPSTASAETAAVVSRDGARRFPGRRRPFPPAAGVVAADLLKRRGKPHAAFPETPRGVDRIGPDGFPSRPRPSHATPRAVLADARRRRRRRPQLTRETPRAVPVDAVSRRGKP